VLAPFLCVVVLGESFRSSIPQLRILALGGPGIVALKLFGNALTAQRQPMRETAAIGFAFVAIVVLDIVLIPTHGGMGASIASTIAYTIGGVAAGVIFLRTLPGRARDLVPRMRDVGALGEQVSEARRRLTAR
jgi:O-antigen/teichoic acid export membrane protein